MSFVGKRAKGRLPWTRARTEPFDRPIVTGTFKGVFTLTRRELPLRTLRDHGWPSDLAVVRTVLPEHVQRAAPPGTAAYGSWFVVAEAAQRPVGFAWAVPYAGDPRGAYIEEVAVVAEHAGRGLGGELLRQIAEWMIELDRPELHIYPTSGSGWVERVGFQPEGSDSFFGDALIVATSR